MAHAVGEGTRSPVTIAPDRLREALAERSLALELGRGGMATVLGGSLKPQATVRSGSCQARCSLRGPDRRPLVAGVE